jgi:hypothetical protein
MLILYQLSQIIGAMTLSPATLSTATIGTTTIYVAESNRLCRVPWRYIISTRDFCYSRDFLHLLFG